MATIVSMKNGLEQQYRQVKKCSVAGVIVGLGCTLLFLVSTVLDLPWLYPVALLGAVAGFIFAVYMEQKANIYEAGVAGEQVTAQIISDLSDQYFGVQNLQVTFEDKTSELDMVVVGPTGVFVIETKNHRGTILGDYEDQYWTHNKISHQGNEFTKELYNPVKQVGTHVYRLANFLRSNGIHVRVESAVYFSDPETLVDLCGEPKQIPVFTAREDGKEALHSYIINRTVRISDVQIQNILRLLNR